MNDGYVYPGGGLLKLEHDLTDDERQQYIDFMASKGLLVLPEDVVVENGSVTIRKWRRFAHATTQFV